MPITYTFHDAGVVVTRFTGRVTDREFIAFYTQLYTDPDYVPGTSELADLRPILELDVSPGALRRVEELARERYAGTDTGFRTAVIATRDQAYGLARMYEVFAEDGPEAVRVCRTLAQALEWLGLEADAVEL
ncbi:MAG: hypothetical protein ACOCUW_04850 [Gemmatimonadota bacterium]